MWVTMSEMMSVVLDSTHGEKWWFYNNDFG